MVSPVGPSAPPGPLTLTFSLAGQMLAQVPCFSTHLVTSQPGPQAPQHQPSGPRPTPHLSPGVWSLRPSHFYASCLPGQAGLRSRKNGAFLYMLHIIRSAPPPEGCHMMGVCPGIHQRAPWAPLLPPGGVPGTQGRPASQAPTPGTANILLPAHSHCGVPSVLPASAQSGLGSRHLCGVSSRPAREANTTSWRPPVPEASPCCSAQKCLWPLAVHPHSLLDVH